MQTKAVDRYYVRREGGIAIYPIPVVTNGRQTGFIGDRKLYIGRANHNLKASPLANPYKIGRDGNRDEVVEKYRRWLWGQCQQGGPARRELEAIAQRVRAGEAVELVCWCKPRKCHGDIVARCVGWMLSREVASANIVDCDLLTVTEGIVAHQVNCKGVMGAGLAKAIRTKWPQIYATYRSSVPHLGEMQAVQVGDRLWVANLAAQQTYGRIGRYTDYDALERCLVALHRFSRDRDLVPYLPFGLGCGLAGGNWNAVAQIIDRAVPNAIVCRKL